VIYPTLVAVVSAACAGVVSCQYAARRRSYQLAWALALVMSAAAATAYVAALPPTSSATAFRLYYSLGAVLMPAWLGLGSVLLVAPKRFAEWATSGLVSASALGAGAVFATPISTGALATLDGGPGAGVLEAGAWLPLTIVLNTVGVAAVVGVAIYSAVALVRRRGSGQLLLANISIAAGDIIVGIAGSMARTGHPELFWATMLVGWIVVFGGFLLTLGSRPGSAQRKLDPLPAPAERTPVA
jgi:hypothetical protein